MLFCFVSCYKQKYKFSYFLNYNNFRTSYMNKITFRKNFDAIPDLESYTRAWDVPEQLLQDCMIRNFKLIMAHYHDHHQTQLKVAQFKKFLIPKAIVELLEFIKQKQKQISKQRQFQFFRDKYRLNMNKKGHQSIHNRFLNIQLGLNYFNHTKKMSCPANYSSFTKDSTFNNDFQYSKQALQGQENRSSQLKKTSVQKDFTLDKIKSRISPIKLQESSQEQTHSKKISHKKQLASCSRQDKHFDIVKAGNDWILASINSNNYNDTFLQTRRKKRINLLSCSEMRSKMIKSNKLRNNLSQAKNIRKSSRETIQFNQSQEKKSLKYFIKDSFRVRVSQTEQVMISLPLQLPNASKFYLNQNFIKINNGNCSTQDKQNSGQNQKEIIRNKKKRQTITKLGIKIDKYQRMIKNFKFDVAIV